MLVDLLVSCSLSPRLFCSARIDFTSLFFFLYVRLCVFRVLHCY